MNEMEMRDWSPVCWALYLYNAKFGVQWATKKMFQQGMAPSLN